MEPTQEVGSHSPHHENHNHHQAGPGCVRGWSANDVDRAEA